MGYTQRMPKGNPSKIVLRSTRDISEKKFACDACERKFFTKKDAKRHMVVHTGKRDFVCARCPQRFGRKDHLVRHFKKSHNSSLRKIAGIASHVSEADSLIPITADGITNKSPHRNTNMSLKQETGNDTACQHATEFGHRLESPTKLVGLSNAVIKEKQGTELASDCHDLSALVASSVDAFEPASEASGMILDDTQIPAMSPLDPAHPLDMDTSAYRSIFGNVDDEAVYKLRMVQLHNMLAEQSGVVAVPAQSPISNIQAKLIRQSGGFVIETADQFGSECEIDVRKRQESGEFGPDVCCSGSILSNPSSPGKTELCLKQEVFFTDLMEEVDPEDYVNSLTPPHSETAHSGQVSPHEIEASDGCFQPPAFVANKEQQLLESRVLELLNNNPLRIPTDAPSMLSYLCDLAAESIAMGDSQSPSQSDQSSSSQGDCWNRSRLPFFPDDQEMVDLNQLLEQVGPADECIVPEPAAATAKNLHAGEKQDPSLSDFEPDLLLLGHNAATSLLSAAREDHASEAWFCERGDLLEGKHFRGCGMEPNELEQMPAWLCQAWKTFEPEHA